MASRSSCPIALTLDLVGDRWTLVVVRDLVLGKTRFEEFLKSPEGIATNILSSRLRRLQELAFVEAKLDAEDGRRIHYRLTPKGEPLRDLITDIAAWGLKHCPDASIRAEDRVRLAHAIRARKEGQGGRRT
jgi:DNA-binding HxlR family transcriptional regulator